MNLPGAQTLYLGVVLSLCGHLDLSAGSLCMVYHSLLQGMAGLQGSSLVFPNTYPLETEAQSWITQTRGRGRVTTLEH